MYGASLGLFFAFILCGTSLTYERIGVNTVKNQMREIDTYDSATSRSLLYLGPRDLLAPWTPLFQQEGWDVIFATGPEEVPGLITKTAPMVGLIAFGERELADNGRRIEIVVAQAPALRWIALIPREAAERPILRQLIGGAFYDYHSLPIDGKRLLLTLGHARGMAQIAADAMLSEDWEANQGHESEMVGASPQMQKIYQEIRKVACVDAPVLITGESGTGKELTAQAIHERSSRAEGPFVAVNCGALPTNLIQSELFGHEKGAFTGAHEKKLGRIENASGGTLFLDEIGDLPMELQTNLLRFLQEKTIHRIGGRQDIHVDVRVLAATHVNLETAIKDGRFRQDLYYRLNVLQIKMPPLKDRTGDIPLLAQYIFRRFANEKGHRVKGFSEEAMHAMNHYDWPGNIRELINRVRRAMVMCEKFLISPVDLGLERRTNSRMQVTLTEARDNAEVGSIRAALAQSRGSVTVAAQQLGISRVSLYRLMEKHGITKS